MKSLINHPLFFAFSCAKNRITRNEYIKWIFLFLPFIFLVCLRFYSDICACTIFNFACFLQLFLVITVTGREATTGIVSEREKKTLDSLRLTSIGPGGIVIGKIIPDIFELLKIILITSPWILLLGWSFSEAGFIKPFFVIAISIYSGFTMLCSFACLSAYSSTTSSAIVMSWILRFIWIFLTPLIDSLFSSILMRSTTTPILSNLNPAVPLIALIMPESLKSSSWNYGVYIFPFIIPVFCIASILLAAKFIESSDKNSVKGERKGLNFFIAESILDSLPVFTKVFKNPIFLKEMVSFRRDFLGLIPGVLVFMVLLLAPYFYCVNSGVKMSDFRFNRHNRDIIVEDGISKELTKSQTFTGKRDTGITVTNRKGQKFQLPGHRENLCMRLILYRFIALPLPGGDNYASNNYYERQVLENSKTITLEEWLDTSKDPGPGWVTLDKETIEKLRYKVEAENLPWFEITDRNIHDIYNQLGSSKADSLSSIRDIKFTRKDLRKKLSDLNFNTEEIEIILKYSNKVTALEGRFTYCEYNHKLPKSILPSQLANLQLNRKEIETILSVVTVSYSKDSQVYNTSSYKDNNMKNNKTLAVNNSIVKMSENRNILLGGFYMSIFLILLYLVIRCSGFLCSTYNTEKNKLTWDLLILTQLSPKDIINGKLWGILFVPLLQMSIGFLAMSFWIYKGIITFWGALGFYIFCILVAVVAGLLGQYTSITSQSAHISQGKTLLMAFTIAFFLPLIEYFLLGIMHIFGINLKFGSFIYAPFLVNTSSIITLNPFSFIFTLVLLAFIGYLFWTGIEDKLEEALNL